MVEHRLLHGRRHLASLPLVAALPPPVEHGEGIWLVGGSYLTPIDLVVSGVYILNELLYFG